MLLACIGMGWLGVKMQQARKQRTAINAIQAGGGWMMAWSGNLAPTFFFWRSSHEPEIPGWRPVCEDESRVHAWLRRLLGDDFVTYPIDAVVTSSAGMEHLGGLPQLESLFLKDDQIVDSDLTHLKCLPRLTLLYIYGNTITDAGLNHVTELTQLRKVYISNKKVSDNGVRKLQQALPNCEIHHKK
jgi:hypothetical protein